MRCRGVPPTGRRGEVNENAAVVAEEAIAEEAIEEKEEKNEKERGEMEMAKASPTLNMATRTTL